MAFIFGDSWSILHMMIVVFIYPITCLSYLIFSFKHAKRNILSLRHQKRKYIKQNMGWWMINLRQKRRELKECLTVKILLCLLAFFMFSLFPWEKNRNCGSYNNCHGQKRPVRKPTNCDSDQRKRGCQWEWE